MIQDQKKKKESVAASRIEACLTALFVITNNIGTPGQARWVQNHHAHQPQAMNVSVNATTHIEPGKSQQECVLAVGLAYSEDFVGHMMMLAT